MRGLVVLTLTLGIVGAGQAREADQPAPLAIAVTVYDYAGVPPDTLRVAKDQMKWIYLTIGIAIQWNDSAVTQPRLRASSAGIGAQSGLPACAILIRPNSSPVPGADSEMLGAAQSGGSERGRIAYVYWDNVQRFGPFAGRILGHVMAHEIGHLLLPNGAHSPNGLMRARWDNRDMDRLRTGGLLFTRDQADRIRRRVAELVAQSQT